MKRGLFVLLFFCIVLDWYIKTNIAPKSQHSAVCLKKAQK